MTPAKKPRVLVSTDCFLPRWDGVSRFLAEVVPSLIQEFDVTVACPNFGPAPASPARLVRFPVYAWRVGDINLARVDRSSIHRLVADADVIFNQTMGPIGIAVVREASRQGKPVVCYIHSIDWELFSKGVRWGKNIVWYMTRLYERFRYNTCGLLLVPSSEVKEVLEGAGFSSKKKVVGLGVDVQAFLPPGSKEKAKQKVGLHPQSLVVGFSGRIAREKSLSTLKDAFVEAKQSIRQATLLVVGGGVQSEAERVAGQDVVMTGMVKNVVPYLQAMDVFVLPSLTETSSLATMEAMSCGVPVIATPVGNIKEYIIEGENGFLFPKGNARALADRLLTVLQDDALRQRMGRAARTTAVKRFRWSKTMTEIKKALRNAVRG